MKYVAFLRGINVGGNHKVPMGELRNCFEALGFTEVKTLLNSGNVVFSGDESDASILREKIEAGLEEAFGFSTGSLIRTQKELHKMITENPFKRVSVTPQIRLYVTFLSEKPTSTLQIPYESPEKNFSILEVSNKAIFSVLTLSEKYNTTDAMKVIEKEFGKNVTTRNWNTIIKLTAL